MNRVAFLVDGFNVYHSLLRAERIYGRPVKWLNLPGLLESYLGAIGGGAQIESMHYFSALAHHIDARRPGTVARHVAYIECLNAVGVSDELAKFKTKNIRCAVCRRSFVRNEEKGTDVALSVKLLEVFALDKADTAVLVTGDSDLVPAVLTARQLWPKKQILCFFPPNRFSKDLKDTAHRIMKIRSKRFARFQFPDPFVLPNGREVRKPAGW